MPERTRERALLIVAAVSAVLLAVTYLVFIRTEWGQRLDDLAFDGRAVEDPEITRRTNDLLHSVTRSTLVLLTGALVAFALARRRPRLALIVGAAVTSAVLTTEILKLHVLTRPDLDGIAGIEQNSFPSGHATIGMALSLGIVMVAPHRQRWLAAIAALAVSMVFGIGVLATGWHRPSDTVGAYLVCVISFSVATAILLRWRGSGHDEMGTVEAALSPPAAIAAGVLVVVAATFLFVQTLQADSIRTVEFAGAYVVVCAGILALAAVIVIGYAQSLRSVALDAPRPVRDRAPDALR